MRHLGGLIILSLGFGACGGSHTGHDAGHAVGDGGHDGGHSMSDVASIDSGLPIACSELGGYCHEVDPDSGPLHECHEGGHKAAPAWCAANLARCYALCTEARNAMDGGTDGGHTAHDGGHTAHDGGHTAHDGGVTQVACTLLGSYCHSVDPGSGPLHECHEGAHDGDATWCAANVDRCYTLCTAARDDAGVAPDGGAGRTHGAIACTLVGSYCHSVDPGSGPLHECHEGAHDGDATWCAANVQRCYDLCRAARSADAGASTSDAATHGGDGGHH